MGRLAHQADLPRTWAPRAEEESTPARQSRDSEKGKEISTPDELDGDPPDVQLSDKFNFADDLFSSPTCPAKERKTRAERRHHNQQYLSSSKAKTRDELIQAQQCDPEIQHWQEKEKPCYKTTVTGVLCQRWRPKNRPTEVCNQIVLPPSYRQNVLKLAHDMPMAGHLGRERTLHRILKRFWWPTVFADTKKYCQSCPECQRVARRPPKAPMIPMPVIGEPFERIAMDVVGPLPRTDRGHQYTGSNAAHWFTKHN